MIWKFFYEEWYKPSEDGYGGGSVPHAIILRFWFNVENLKGAKIYYFYVDLNGKIIEEGYQHGMLYTLRKARNDKPIIFVLLKFEPENVN